MTGRRRKKNLRRRRRDGRRRHDEDEERTDEEKGWRNFCMLIQASKASSLPGNDAKNMTGQILNSLFKGCQKLGVTQVLIPQQVHWSIVATISSPWGRSLKE